MDVYDLNTKINDSLFALYANTEIESFFFLLINFRLNLNKIDYVLNKDYQLSNEDILFFENTINRLKQEEPIQYILGQTEFYGLKFYVNKSTLIPRPETEELVDWIIKDNKAKNKEDLRVLDIGTGSGCIPISLALNITKSKITSIDVSADAIGVAKENALLNNVKVDFVKDSILQPVNISSSSFIYDIIVSNPPYVRNLEKKEIKNNVLNYEPHTALFVEDNDPLIFYKKISEYALNHLSEKGILYLEINQYLGVETIAMLKEVGFQNIEIRKDFSGNDRMIKAFN